MPTINEVWEQAVQVNANLAQLHNDLTALRNEADETNSRLESLEQLTGEGFASLADGVVALQARADVANLLLDVLVKQGAAVLCNLEKLSQLTCRLLEESVQQTASGARAADGIEALVHMMATAHPQAGLAWKREQEMNAKMDECCPPEPGEPPCRYEPCPAPAEPKWDRPKLYESFQLKARDVRGKGRRAPK